MMSIMEIIGWGGAVFYVVSYLLLSLRVLKASSAVYHSLNVLGACGLIANALHFHDTPNIVVNAVWLLIGCFGILASRWRYRNGGSD